MNAILDRIFDALDGGSSWPAAVFMFIAVAGMTLAIGNLVRARGDIRRRATREAGGALAIADLTPEENARSLGADTMRTTRAMLEAVTRHFAPQDSDEQSRVKQLMIHAGFFAPNAPAIYLASRVGAALVMAGLGIVFLPDLFGALSTTNLWMFAGGAGLAGYLMPMFYLSRRTDRLQTQYRSGFPDFMDLMVICADAGLAMEAAMDRVGRELAVSYPALSANIAMTTLEMRAGRTLSDALDHLAQRLGIEEARSFATLLQQSEELGSSMTEALRVYSDDMRHKRMSRAEEKAYALPAKLVIPLGLCIFPVILVVTLLPVIVRVKTGTF